MHQGEQEEKTPEREAADYHIETPNHHRHPLPPQHSFLLPLTFGWVR